LQLQSAGLVSKLYKVDDYYTVRLHDQLCADSILLKAAEGSKRRETKISFDRENGKASYLERDLLKNSTVLAKEIETPACVQDVIGGLFKLRTLKLEPGQSTTLPMSNGKKFVHVRVEAQEREEVKTRTGKYNTVRYEAFLFNNVLYSKKGRVFVWITDDARRLPVQIKAKMRFVIGTITLQLERDGATPAAGATPAGN
ncbi:MAG: DUF3108 domain-containing protein, partial [Acidobacteria bacterium]|nr:DUF3108 domain-containing protein [Acidobacteriota bacterium]